MCSRCCCQNACQGCVLIWGAFYACFGSLLMAIMAGYLAFDERSVLLGYRWLGVLTFLLVLGMAASGALGVLGAMRDSHKLMRYAIGSIFASVLCLLFVLIGFLYVQGNVDAEARNLWFSMQPEQRGPFEAKLSCCGYDTVEDTTTENCPFKQPCSQVFAPNFKNWCGAGVQASALSMFLGVFTAFFFLCYYVKMSDRGPGSRRTKRNKNMTIQEEIAEERAKQGQGHAKDPEWMRDRQRAQQRREEWQRRTNKV